MPLDQDGNLSSGPGNLAGEGEGLRDAALSATSPAPPDSSPAPPAPSRFDPRVSTYDPDSPRVPGPFSCSRCGANIPITAGLSAAVEALPDAARRLDVALLCFDCSTTGRDLDAAQPPSSDTPGTRIFRAEVLIRELVPRAVPGVTVPGVEVTTDAWQDVAGFAIEGPGRSVRDFTDSHAEEWATRMEQVLKFADL